MRNFMLSVTTAILVVGIAAKAKEAANAFAPIEGVPAMGSTPEGKMVILQLDVKGYVVCSSERPDHAARRRDAERSDVPIRGVPASQLAPLQTDADGYAICSSESPKP